MDTMSNVQLGKSFPPPPHYVERVSFGAHQKKTERDDTCRTPNESYDVLVRSFYRDKS